MIIDIHTKINIRSNFTDMKNRGIIPYCRKFIKAHLNICHFEQPYFNN
jgi:hypothetical protein